VSAPEAVRKAEGGQKDEGKAPWHLLPWEALEQVVLVLGDSAGLTRHEHLPPRRADYAPKYGPHNWRKGLSWAHNAGSIARHLAAYLSGEDLDPESLRHHMACVACRALFALEFARNNTGVDDRYNLPRLRHDARGVPERAVGLGEAGRCGIVQDAPR
jgi:hypothetical protein